MMVILALTGLIGILTGGVLFAATGWSVGDWRWWAIMVPASWLWTVVYHIVDRRGR
jgi:hypothetical protein